MAATFHALTLPGRLAIDNPLDREAFERDMAGKPAILTVDGDRGRAVLFSPHPEMGDLVRKYMALDGYVRRYLPARGMDTMRDTLRHYRVSDAPSFRLVLNAVDILMADGRSAHRQHAADWWANLSSGEALTALCAQALAGVPDLGGGDEAILLRDIASSIVARLDAARGRLANVQQRARVSSSLEPARKHLELAIAQRWKDEPARTIAQNLMEADLAVALVECWTRAAAFDQAVAEPV